MFYKLFIIFVLTLFFSVAFAEKIVTYTAVSKISQEDANNTAMAGVAKQISSQVNATQTLSKKEFSTQDSSKIYETYKAQSVVKSNLKIKGILISEIHVEKGYKAIATLNLDEYTADIQFKLKTLKQEIFQYQDIAITNLKNRQYAIAIDATDSLKIKVELYNELVNYLAQVYPVDSSFLLSHKIFEIESMLKIKLSQIKIECDTATIALSENQTETVTVTVSDSIGPVENFPLLARQKSNILQKINTQNNGTAKISLKGANTEHKPFTVTIQPDFKNWILDKFDLHKEVFVNYSVKRDLFEVRVHCDKDEKICNAITERLLSKNILVTKNDKAKLLNIKISITKGKSLQINESISRTQYAVEISVTGDNINFFKSINETAKNADEALAKAVHNVNFSKLREQLKNSIK